MAWATPTSLAHALELAPDGDVLLNAEAALTGLPLLSPTPQGQVVEEGASPAVVYHIRKSRQ